MADGESLFLNPTLWTTVALGLFTGLVVWKARKPILGGLDKRADDIRAKLEEAERLREEAQTTLAAYQRKQRDAVAEAEELVAHAKEEAARLREQSLAQLTETLERRERIAMEKIAQAEANALQQVRAQAVDVAIAAAGKMMAEGLPKDRGAALLDEAIADLPGKLN